MDGYEYLRQIEFRIAILRDKLEYLGEAFCTEEEMRLASLANFPPLNFCCYPAVPDQYLVPSCPWWEATEEAITEMKNWHRRQAIKCCCGILHFMKMAGKTPRKTDRKTAAYEPPRESRGFTGKNWPAKHRITRNDASPAKKEPRSENPGAGNETEKILEAEGKRASLLREEPFFYARDSVEYKVHLMIWGTRGKERVVEVETFKISRTQRQ